MRKPELSELQEVVYNIFVEFDRVCRKYGIKYSMEGGTLLGAVKYGDFVPWDDDIDVIMLRDDYDKFMKIAPQELHADYCLQSYHSVPEFPLNYAKLCYNKSTIYDYVYSHIKEMNHGVFIDIFPIDRVRPDKMNGQLHIIGLLTGARRTKLKIKMGNISKVKRLCYQIVSMLPMRTLCWLMDRVCTWHNGCETGYCYEVCNSNRNFKPLPSSVYNNTTYLKFRRGEYMAVESYHEFLQSRFGKDYMQELPEEEKRKPSHSQNILLER